MLEQFGGAIPGGISKAETIFLSKSSEKLAPTAIFYDPFLLPPQNAPHRVRCFPLRLCGHMGVGIEGKARAVVAQHAGNRFHVHTVLECQGSCRVPIGYNKDKSETPVISRG